MIDIIDRSSEKLNVLPVTTILGGSGFVGSSFLRDTSFPKDFLFAPSSNQVNVLDKESIRRFVRANSSKVLVNMAAYTDVKKADKEIVEAWRLNVIGAGNVAQICLEENIFYVHISTDNVFLDLHHMACEDDTLCNKGDADWYSYTKTEGERVVESVDGKTAIVRIAYPFGDFNPQKDYFFKLIRSIKMGLPIFCDQQFTPTYLPTFSKAVLKIISGRLTGKFHVACGGLTTPYEIASFIVRELGLSDEVKISSVLEYEKRIGKKSSYNDRGGLRTEHTQKVLGMVFPTWQEAVREFAEKIKD